MLIRSHKSNLLLISLFALALFGFGCDKPKPEISNTNNNSRLVTLGDQAKVRQVQAEAPKGLAYVVIADDSSATVWRGKKEREAHDGLALYAGDRLIVTSGQVKLIYPDSGASMLQSGAEITILPDGQPKSQTGIGTLILLKSGEIWSRFERLFNEDETFSVEANGVVATVRGTAFGVTNKDGKVGIKVADHNVRVAMASDLKSITDPQKKRDVGVVLAAGQKMNFDPQQMFAFADIDEEAAREGSGKPMAAPPPPSDFMLEQEIQQMTEDDLNDPGYQFGAGELPSWEMEEPREPLIWDAPMELNPEFESYLDPDALQRYQEAQEWIRNHEQEIMEAERIRAEMEASGMFENPYEIPPDEYYPPGEEPYLEGPAPEEPVYDDNGNIIYEPPELFIIGYDDNGNPIYGNESNYEVAPYDPGVMELPVTEPVEPNNSRIELLGVPAE